MSFRFVSLACIVSCAFAAVVAAPASVTEQDVAARLAAAPRVHPRLFATAADFDALKARVATNDLARRTAARVLKEADARLKRPLPQHKLTGFRLLGPARDALHSTLALSMAWRLTGEAKYRDGALAIVRTVTAFEDWNPKHFLDVSEFALGVAVAYDWLYDTLDDATRAEIERALVRLAIDPSFAGKGTWWIKGDSNWSSVCHAGQIAAALAVADVEPRKAAAAIHRAIVNLPRPAAVLAPNGAYPEGPGYWHYGAGFHVLALAMLEKRFGTDFGLGDVPGWKETGDFLDLVTGPTGLYFNFSDGGDKRGSDPVVWWFAQRYNRPDRILNFETRLFEKALAGAGVDRLFPLVLLWQFDVPAGTQPQCPLTWRSGGVPQLAVQRSNWTTNAFFVALKAGSPSINHGHMDGGSFVLDAAGKRWVIDLGAEGYNGIESRGMQLWSRHQTADRWRVFRLNNFAHNTLAIDDSLQLVKGVAKVLDPVAGREDEVTLDLSPLYTNATKVVRSARLGSDGRSWRVVDRLAGLRPGAKVRWCVNTKAKATVEDDAVRLVQGGDVLCVVQNQTTKGAWQIVEEPKPNEWDSRNKNVRQLVFAVAAPASGELTLDVTFALEGK